MDGDARTVGAGLRQIRQARHKSLRVVAGLAGISAGHLSRIENGERALDRRSLIVALADALQVAPSELTALPVPATTDGGTDTAVDAVRLALLAVVTGLPGGAACDAGVLQARVGDVLDAQQACRHDTVAAALPGLIHDLHATLAGGRQAAEVLRLVTLLHVQGTQAWLRDVGAPLDLAWQAATLSQQAADQLADPQTSALATFGTTHGLLAAGAFDLARAQLEAAAVSTATVEGMQLIGMLAFTRSLLAAAEGNGDDVTAPLQTASELAELTGEANAYWFGFGPTNVGVWRMAVQLETGDYARAAAVAERIDPTRIPSPQRRAAYWADYGRALTRIRGRRDDAVWALRRAELISPARVHRHPFTRQVLAELVARSRRDAVGRELRGMAYRAGLPV